jgi:tetratricopeptide (TPR) repeat protein
MTIQQAVELGLQHHLGGRLQEAEAIYVQILNAQPNHPETLHLMGVMALQIGRFDMSVDFINRAIAVNPNDGRYFSNLGQALSATGRIDDAIAAYQRALTLMPNLPEAYNNLGNALQDKGQYEQAAQAYQEGLRQRSDFVEARNNLGNALKHLGQLEAAIESYRHALSIRPEFPDAWSNLGTALLDKGLVDESIEAHRRAVELRPDSPDVHNNLAQALQRKGQLTEAIDSCRRSIALSNDFVHAYLNLGSILVEAGQIDEAIVACRRALVLQPNLAEAHNNLGNAFRAKRLHDEAIASYQNAIALRPDYADVLANLGRILDTTGRYEEAIETCRRAIAIKPDHADAYSDMATALIHVGRLKEGIVAYQQAVAIRPGSPLVHYNLGLALLQNGDFRQGWPECEWRWQVKEIDLPQPRFIQPKWDGSELNGQKILLYAEQGFGDTIQFARFARLVTQRGGRVILACQPELSRLLRGMERVEQIVESAAALPEFDFQHALMSLPLIFDTTIQTVPAETYLRADPELSAQWRERMGPDDGRMKIGLTWFGRPTHPNDQQRSIPPELLTPLAQVPGARWFNLQKPASPGPEIDMIDLMPQVQDFADTAAIIDHLDLVITVDTSVAHVAGAMGKPVWLMLPFMPDWRWLLGRDDSPWYRSMRLFRQPAIGDWQAVVQEVTHALAGKTPGPVA